MMNPKDVADVDNEKIIQAFTKFNKLLVEEQLTVGELIFLLGMLMHGLVRVAPSVTMDLKVQVLAACGDLPLPAPPSGPMS